MEIYQKRLTKKKSRRSKNRRNKTMSVPSKIKGLGFREALDILVGDKFNHDTLW